MGQKERKKFSMQSNLSKFEKQKIGNLLLDIISILQDDLATQIPETHSTDEEIMKSPFIHAESFKKIVIDVFDLSDDR